MTQIKALEVLYRSN